MIKNSTVLAKSSGVTLIDHSTNVSINALKLSNISFGDDFNIKYGKLIRLSSLLHDIGKCTESFQKKLKKNDSESSNKFRHNEIGWAFLYNWLNLPESELYFVIDSVYWHHGISNKMNGNTYLDILRSITSKDIEMMKLITISLIGDELLLKEPREETIFTDIRTPNYYTNDIEKTITNQMIRLCLISADRITSMIEDDNSLEINNLINKILFKENNLIIGDYKYGNNERFLKQLSISKECEKTTIIKAPAGFGKTLTGILWSSLSDKKLIWVAPRNAVAKSIYDSIINELSNLYQTDIKVELFLSGEVITSNFSDGDADIIITNIDNYLSPTVDNSKAEKMFSVVNVDIIFDEYHELICEAALFSAFINIMKIRHGFSNSRTLLLSATPAPMEYLWEGLVKTTILPNSNEHYSSIHNKEYKINLTNEFKVISNDSLVIYNSIRNSQLNMGRHNCENIFHSNFSDVTINEKINNIFITNGKNAICEKLNNTIGTLIIQASLDISFQNLYESVMSPESTLQRIGRCNRWGELDNCTINIIKGNDRSEKKIIEILYNQNISDMWFDFLEENTNDYVTLDLMYKLYNKFSIENKTIIKSFIRAKYNESLKNLLRIYPIKYYNTKVKTKKFKSSGNKLRSLGGEIFFIVKNHNSETYSDIFSTRIYHSIDVEFGETSNILTRIIGSMKTIRNQNDIRYEYNDLIDNKKITIDEIRRNGVNSNTPYIRYDLVYHPIYGLISENNLSLIE